MNLGELPEFIPTGDSNMLECGNEIDRRLDWPIGRAERLAKQGKLVHHILPDGSIRFVWSEVERQIKKVEPS